LDKDLILRQFEQLEKKVENLVGICRSLTAANSELKLEIEGLQQELRKKIEDENIFNQERGLVRSRVDSLLARLENISET
jgi:hypothetical protein